MARGDLLCPLDSLVLGLPGGSLRGVSVRDGVVGGHLHWAIDVTLTCANGHRWKVAGELVMERQA